MALVDPSLTADVVAATIVHACRETGESPIDCAKGEPAVRARHYAMHALVRVFPEAEVYKLVALVGPPGKVSYYWRNSKQQVANPKRGIVRAKWWDKQIFQRTVDAVFRAIAGLPAPAVPKPRPKEAPSSARRNELPREREQFAARPLPDYLNPPAVTHGGASKPTLESMLKGAVENTAKLQKRGEKT